MTDFYTVFQPWVDYVNLEFFKLWYNNLPPGGSVECCLSPVKAIPLVKNKIVRPTISVGDFVITFPVELESGSYLELTSPTECRIYNADGEIVGEVMPEGRVPQLQAGPNRISFSCQETPGLSTRARVTLISSGSPL
jgi:hypothetical protein